MILQFICDSIKIARHTIARKHGDSLDSYPPVGETYLWRTLHTRQRFIN